MKLLTAGESHGKALVGIIEGLPSGATIDVDKVNIQLDRRRQGAGRGGRMKIESDCIDVISGMRNGVTLGSPLSFMIANLDYKNWESIMSCTSADTSLKVLSAVRPGHADLSGVIKYDFTDARNVLERASARETATRVACGGICRQVLESVGISISSTVLSIGGKSEQSDILEQIKNARSEGDTLGGEVEICVSGMPVGVGSYVHFDRKLDAILSFHLMSIQSVKAVSFGAGTEYAYLKGSEAHDELYADGRKTNRAGGIEGGMSNGEDIIIKLAFKPIPTLMKGLNTIDIRSKDAVKAASERSDVCAVEAGGVVAENVTAFAVLDCVLNTFGGDNMKELISRVQARREVKI